MDRKRMASCLLIVAFVVTLQFQFTLQEGRNLHKLSLRKKSSGFERWLNSQPLDGDPGEMFVNWYNASIPSVLPNNSYVPLKKFLDVEFYGEVAIGAPEQKFLVAFDTSWADSWVPSISCSTIDSPCGKKNRYNSKKSSTYVKNGTEVRIPYGDDALTGWLSQDLFHVGRLNVTNQFFIEMNHLPKDLYFIQADGIVGLGLKGHARATPLFYNLFAINPNVKPIFSTYYNRDPTTPKAGTILFGGIDKKHYKEPITYVPVIDRNGYWEIPVDSIKLSNSPREFCNNCTAIIATSASAILGTVNEIDMINQLIKARQFYFGKHLVDCNTIPQLPKITFTIKGRQFVLDGKYYVQKMSWKGFQLCVSSFETLESDTNGSTWVFGVSFLSKYYGIFDPENLRLGLATMIP